MLTAGVIMNVWNKHVIRGVLAHLTRWCVGPAIIMICALWQGGCAVAPVPLDKKAWNAFLNHYVEPTGRVIDREKGGITHSEAQGNTLLLATAFDTPEVFATVWSWTQSHLQIRSDRLFAWRWDPTTNPHVTDINNASDADILIAWSLLRAAKKWALPHYMKESETIMDGLRNQMQRSTPNGTVIVPGTIGFERDNSVVVNLSYWVFPALIEFAAQWPQDRWQNLVEDGLSLLDRARFGRWGLPADWIEVGTGIQIAQGFPPRFSYDAIRIPMYLYWAGLAQTTRMMPYLAFWEHFRSSSFTPAWTNLMDDSVDSYDASPGFYSIFALAYQFSEKKHYPATKRKIETQTSSGYYSDVLHLLANVAEHEARTSKDAL